MKEKMKEPKFKNGQKVFCSVTKSELTIKSDGVWNGRTYMYSFDGTDMRCGEEYLKLAEK